MNWLLQNSIKILLFTMVSLTITAEPSKTPLPLAGIAVQEKLRVPIFYAAVFSQHNTEKNFTRNSNFPLRMEVRYIQDKFSKRQNHQLWIERILINTPRSELEGLSDELLEFSRMMKHEMKKGDQLVFEYYPGSGTRVIFNEVLIKTFKNFEFQKALTAIWYGKRPPTIIFQQTLLSPPNQKLLNEFNQLSFDAARKREVAQVFGQEQQPPAKVAKAETKKVEVKKQTTPTKKKTQTKKKVVKETQPKKSANSNKTAQRKEAPGKKSQPKVVEREKPIVPPKQQDSAPKEKSQRAATTFDQIILEMKDDYVEEVKNYIESKARPIPPRKVRRKPKSDARILVSFVEKGGAIEVIDSKIIDGEFQPELVEVLHQSIKELKKIPLMPTPINDQTLTVEVELSFSKCKRTPSAWLCF